MMPLDDSTVAPAIEDPWSVAFIKARAVEEDGAKLFNDKDTDPVIGDTITHTGIHSIGDDSEVDQPLNESELKSEQVTIEVTDNAKKRALEEVRDEIDRDGGFRQPKRLAYFFKRRCTDPLMP